MINQLITRLLPALTLNLVVGCASQYQVSTNLDKENFRQYFSPAKVQIFQNEQELPARHKLVGLVEGQDCQIKAHHAAPDRIIARTEARRKAYEQGANGIIFTGCTEIESKQCTGLLVCYAKAYQVESK